MAIIIHIKDLCIVQYIGGYWTMKFQYVEDDYNSHIQAQNFP